MCTSKIYFLEIYISCVIKIYFLEIYISCVIKILPRVQGSLLDSISDLDMEYLMDHGDR